MVEKYYYNKFNDFWGSDTTVVQNMALLNMKKKPFASMVPSWSKKLCSGRVLRVMPPSSQTSSYCWLCQVSQVHLRGYDKLSMLDPDTDIFLYANVNLVFSTYCSYMNHLNSIILCISVVVNPCFILLW
jgi:hypothetical protein